MPSQSRGIARPSSSLPLLTSLLVGLVGLGDPHGLEASLLRPAPQDQVQNGVGSAPHDTRENREEASASAPRDIQEAGPELASTLESGDLAHLEWRTIGPGGVGGRIVDFAVEAGNPKTIYAGTAQGGVWKTVNSGTTWEPVFEKEGSSSIGGLAVAPSNPDVVWVGTGEANGRNLVSTSWGDGVYKSEDGGATWSHMGLPLSQQIGRIRIHPDDEETVYVPVVGSLWHNSPEHNAARGLWRTNDGGRSWEKILSAGGHAGIVDLDLNPWEPNVMFAAAWQRERVDWRWLPTGDEGGLFRSLDGGESWQRLTNGLPTSDIGKVGVSVCPSDPDIVYAIFEGPEGGVFRSDDGGESWEQRNSQRRGSHWYAQIRCDPDNPERVYSLETSFMVSHDGGRTFTNEMAGKPVHVDHHALWIDPADSDHLVLGNDGGVYLSGDRGESWRYVSLPVTQYFEIGVGMQEPFYYVCGGTQDNSSHCGPSATRASDGIVNDDWFATSGGDGFYARLDPRDPTIVYSESQNGSLLRVDTKTGERKAIQPSNPAEIPLPMAGEVAEPIEEFRWNWSAPVLVSEWNPTTIYFGAQVLLKSPDRGDSWEIISPDLTKALTYEDQMNDFGTLRVIAESPHREGLLAVGTDDGLVQITEDGGSTWRAARAMPGVPEMALIRRIVFSVHDPRTLYVAASSHEYNDFTPYVMKSTDLGRSWKSIASNLLDGEPVRAFAEHPTSPNLLFVGTERRVWATFDGGGRWIALQNNMPTVAIHDMVIHPRDNDLIVGTHGRGVWILDNLSVLARIADGAPRDAAWMAPTRPTMQSNRYNRGRSSRGTTYFRAPNPPTGVMIDYLVPEDASTPELTIHDAGGRQVRRLELGADEATPGLHRIWWDMRYDPAWTPPPGTSPRGGGGPGGGGRGEGGNLGRVESPWVLPGSYEVRMADGVSSSAQRLEIFADPLVDISAPERRYWHDLQLSLSHILGTARAATVMAQALSDALEEADTIVGSRAPEQIPAGLPERVTRVAEEVQAVLDQLRDISSMAGQAFRGIEGSISTPTEQNVRRAELAYERLGPQLEAIELVRSRELPGIASELEGWGAPTIPGGLLTMPEAARLPERR